MKLAAALIFGLLSVPAQGSDVTQKDIQVIGRTLGFLENPPPDPFDLGIIYIRNDAESARQAAITQKLLADRPLVGKVRLQARLIALDELASLDHLGALFIVPASSQAGPQAAAAGRRLHVPVISTDPTCAEAGYCVLAISSSPTVEIILNRGSADAAGVRFTTAFFMLVKKL